MEGIAHLLYAMINFQFQSWIFLVLWNLTFVIFLLVIAINYSLEALKFVLSTNLGALCSLLLLLKFNYRHEFTVILFCLCEIIFAG